MTTLSKSHPLTTDSGNDRETLKKSPSGNYSHGLEAIYALETIDIKTVRPMLIPFLLKEEEKSSIYAENEEDEIQLTFDLGPFFREWMPPYIMSEPIQVLDLGKHIEKLLVEKNIMTLKELEKFHMKDIASTRGLGQGHIEEIRRKLTDYLAHRPLHRTKIIDFLSLLKCLYGGLDRRKAFTALEPYELENWLILTPLEKMDIKRLHPDERQEWIKEITHVQKSPWLKLQWELLLETWLKPWMLKRGGYATSQQLEEALILRSRDAKIASNTLLLLQSSLAFANYLSSFENVYAASQELHRLGSEIVDCALSYFPLSSSHYELNGLCLLIHAEFAQNWKSASPKTIETVLKLCTSLFSIYRGSSGEWYISRKV